jgi:hypothetical protein
MLQDLMAALSLPGLPDWVAVVLLLALLLVGLAYLLMPFSVFGVKGRLEALEAQLDEIQTEIRSLALRLPEPGRRRPPVEDDWAAPPAIRTAAEQEPPRNTPPVPPPPAWPGQGAGRAEPRLDWPHDRR